MNSNTNTLKQVSGLRHIVMWQLKDEAEGAVHRPADGERPKERAGRAGQLQGPAAALEEIGDDAARENADEERQRHRHQLPGDLAAIQAGDVAEPGACPQGLNGHHATVAEKSERRHAPEVPAAPDRAIPSVVGQRRPSIVCSRRKTGSTSSRARRSVCR